MGSPRGAFSRAFGGSLENGWVLMVYEDYGELIGSFGSTIALLFRRRGGVR